MEQFINPKLRQDISASKLSAKSSEKMVFGGKKQEEQLPFRRMERMKADKRSSSPERDKYSSSSESLEEERELEVEERATLIQAEASSVIEASNK
jgi:hypothetical protein